MFEAIATPAFFRRRSRAGIPVSVLLHLATLAVALLATVKVRQVESLVPPPELHFVKPGAPGTTAARPGPPPAPQHKRRPPQRPQALAPPVVAPPAPDFAEAAPEEEDDRAADSPAIPGLFGGGGGGGGSGSQMEVRDAAPAGPLEYEPAMTPPHRLSGPEPAYTAQALEHEVQGTLVVKCVVTTRGEVHGCRVLHSLPYMDRAVIDALERRRYTPALLGGRPVEVDYTFRILLQLPP
jgi:TonB family protein